MNLFPRFYCKLRTCIPLSTGKRFFFWKTELLESKNVGWAKLKDRAVLRISGPDTIPFLQGLVTNDTRLFERGERSLYAFMLNTQGRVNADVILHSCVHNDGQMDILCECHQKSYSTVADTLAKYKMRKKVDLQNCTDSMLVISIFPMSITNEQVVKGFDKREMFLPATLQFSKSNPPLAYGPDPRVAALGGRLIVCADDVSENVMGGSRPSSIDDYTNVRYMLGVGEGPSDIIPGKALPLEANGDYLNGISFHKGCYIGQELTARTHHTGVVRKRLVPIVLSSTSIMAEDVPLDSAVINIESGKSVGKWRSGKGCHGIALLRIDDAFADSVKLAIQNENGENILCNPLKPFWWPDSELVGQIKHIQ